MLYFVVVCCKNFPYCPSRFVKSKKKEIQATLRFSPCSSLQDITSLLHTIYEVVDTSVNHSPGNSKTLRVKLSVAPDSSQRWRSCAQGATGKCHVNSVWGSCWERRRLWSSISGSVLTAHSETCLLSCRKAVASGLSELCFLAVSASLHPSHSMGFIFNDGGWLRRERERERPLLSLAAFKYPKRNLKRCAKSFW